MRICRFTMLLLVGLASLGVADEPPKKNANGLPLASTPLTPDAQRAAQQLRERFAEGTEARAMLDSLVSEPSLGPDNGWFAMSKAQTRFDWNAVAKRYDQNSDGRVDSSEFRGGKKISCGPIGLRMVRSMPPISTGTARALRQPLQ